MRNERRERGRKALTKYMTPESAGGTVNLVDG
jgi:hypothetical protein